MRAERSHKDMFSIVYVLTSNDKDNYYEQMMISIESVRYHMPKQEIKVITDEKTYASLTGKRRKVFDYADIVKVRVPNQYSQKETSRYLKTSLRKYIRGNLLFIDCDTVICDDFSSFHCDSSIAMVSDMHKSVGDRDDWDETICRRAESCNLTLEKCVKYYNSGVIWLKDDDVAANLFEKWHYYWNKTREKGVIYDQISLNYVNVLCGNVINELPGEWNCQPVVGIEGLKYMNEAHIIHYYSSINVNSTYKLCNNKLISSYDKENNEELFAIIREPRWAFNESVLIEKNADGVILINSRQIRLIRIMHDRLNFLYRFNEKILKCLSRIKK